MTASRRIKDVDLWAAVSADRHRLAWQRGERDPSEGLYDPEMEPKGWRRASLDLNTHPLHPFPNIAQDDLIVPSSKDRLRLLGACLGCGACIAVLWVYFPLFVVSIMLDHRFGVWLWGSMAAVAAVAGVLLFLYASAREQGDAETL